MHTTARHSTGTHQTHPGGGMKSFETRYFWEAPKGAQEVLVLEVAETFLLFCKGMTNRVY